MNISGIYSYAGFYDTGAIKADDSVIPQEAVPQNTDLPGMEIPSPAQTGQLFPPAEDVELQEKQEELPQHPGQDAVTYASLYRPDAEYEMSGPDRNVEMLDIEKVMSDMKKDQVLEQYQYFVGEGLSGTKNADRLEEKFFL